MFKLEALKARHGDCLILQWGTAESPRLCVIDGGPDRTYRESLKPRLATLAGASPTLDIDLLMLSHIDDDHINGLLELAEDIEAGRSPAEIKLLWFNSLEGLLDGLPPGQEAATAAVTSVFKDDSGALPEWEEKVLASVGQGQDLDAAAKKLGLDATMNWPYSPLVMRGAGSASANLHGLSLTPVAPDKAAVEALRKVWKLKRKDVVTAAYRDKSPYNLSSIVVVAEYDGRSMLLTGDALGREVIEGLGELGKLDARGRAHFDLIKLPHHGSQNNVEPLFYETLTADHYVVSGDHVRHPNPHELSMEWLATARGDDDYLVHCPYELDFMDKLFGARMRVPKPGELGISVEL